MKAMDTDGATYEIEDAEYIRRVSVGTRTRVGAWWSLCCEHDLYQIESHADVDEVMDVLWDEDFGWMVRVWETREAAMTQLTAEAPQATQ